MEPYKKNFAIIKDISLTQDVQVDIKYLDFFLDTLQDLISSSLQTLKSKAMQDVFFKFMIKSSDAIVFLNNELTKEEKKD